MAADLRNAVGGMLYFPLFKTQKKAEKAAPRFLELADIADVEVQEYGDKWVVLAHAPLVGLGSDDRETVLAAVDFVTRKCGGDLDGWESGWLTEPSAEVAEEDEA